MSDITVVINGEEASFPSEPTVAVILESRGVDRSRRGIAVAVNDQVVRRDDWGKTVIRGDDRIEIIQATQGG